MEYELIIDGLVIAGGSAADEIVAWDCVQRAVNKYFDVASSDIHSREVVVEFDGVEVDRGEWVFDFEKSKWVVR